MMVRDYRCLIRVYKSQKWGRGELSSLEGIRMAHLWAVIYLSLFPPQKFLRQKSKTLSDGNCKRKSIKQNLMLMGFP